MMKNVIYVLLCACLMACSAKSNEKQDASAETKTELTKGKKSANRVTAKKAEGSVFIPERLRKHSKSTDQFQSNILYVDGNRYMPGKGDQNKYAFPSKEVAIRGYVFNKTDLSAPANVYLTINNKEWVRCASSRASERIAKRYKSDKLSNVGFTGVISNDKLKRGINDLRIIAVDADGKSIWHSRVWKLTLGS